MRYRQGTRAMALFLVRNGKRLVWVVKLTDDVVMFCYDGHLCRFCQSHTLYVDLFFDQELQYQQISVERAEELIVCGVGLYDLNIPFWLLEAREFGNWISFELAMQCDPLTEEELSRRAERSDP